jgi:hypothetical protein
MRGDRDKFPKPFFALYFREGTWRGFVLERRPGDGWARDDYESFGVFDCFASEEEAMEAVWHRLVRCC